MNQKEIKNIKRPMTSKEIETVIKYSSDQKSRIKWLHRKILSSIYRRANIQPSQILPKTYRGRNTPRFILWGHHHPVTKIRQSYHKKENELPISLMNIDTKIINKILANRFQQYINRIMIKWNLFQRCKDSSVYADQSVWYIIVTYWRIKIIWSSQ